MLTFHALGRHGQLGNQLCQYSLLLAVSERTGYPFGVPYQNKSSDRMQHFALPDAFPNLTAKDASGYKTKYEYNEKDGDFWTFCPNVFDVQDDTNFAGYFQTEKYFAQYREKLLREFELAPKYRARATDVKNQLSRHGLPVIFVHVRRGDALGNPDLVQPSRDYYRRAMQHFGAAHFVILTDDPVWCRHNIHLCSASFSPYNIHLCSASFSPFHDKFDDLALMQIADGGIICSSTFSWWGAWLGSADRTIVGPKLWSHRRPCADALPSTWIGV